VKLTCAVLLIVRKVNFDVAVEEQKALPLIQSDAGVGWDGVQEGQEVVQVRGFEDVQHQWKQGHDNVALCGRKALTTNTSKEDNRSSSESTTTHQKLADSLVGAFSVKLEDKLVELYSNNQGQKNGHVTTRHGHQITTRQRYDVTSELLGF
jgi:hypothetical protein